MSKRTYFCAFFIFKETEILYYSINYLYSPYLFEALCPDSRLTPLISKYPTERHQYIFTPLPCLVSPHQHLVRIYISIRIFVRPPPPPTGYNLPWHMSNSLCSTQFFGINPQGHHILQIKYVVPYISLIVSISHPP